MVILAMCSSVSRVEVLKTSLEKPETYELSSTDGVIDRCAYISRPLFFRQSLDWDTLQDALRRVERAYSPVCGRFVADENGKRGILVDPDGENGFAVVEIQTQNTIAELRFGKGMLSGVQPESSFMSWPYFLELDGQDPVLKDSLFGVQMIRASDGCVLNVSGRHRLCDGTRIVQLIADIGRAYRGVDIGQKHLDRSLLWPDQYLPLFSAPEQSADMYPRVFPLTDSIPPSGPPFHTVQLHLTRDINSDLKESTKSLLQDAEFVSANDLATALSWMLRTEISAGHRPVTPSSLPIRGTSTAMPADQMKTCMPMVPERYFGNAVIALFITDSVESPEPKSHIEILARLSSLIREKVNRVKTEPEAVLESLLLHYDIACRGQIHHFANCISTTASQTGMAVEDIDFGQPSYLHMSLNVFSNDPTTFTEDVPDGDGILVYIPVTEEERKILETSVVLAECVPQAKLLSDAMKEHEQLKFMGI